MKPRVDQIGRPTARSSHSASVAAMALLAASATTTAWAQRVSFEASVAARATWTDNAGLQSESQAVEDVITEVTPSLAMRINARRFRLNGDIGATAVNYLNESQVDRVLPRIRLAGNLEAVERLLFVDASVTTANLVENPFIGTSGDTTTVNSYTTTTYSISPYLDWRMSPRTRLNIRSDNSRSESRGSSTPIRDGTFNRQTVRFDVLPQPLGVTIEAERNDSRFSGEIRDTLRQDIARMILSYAASPEWVVNVRSGYEDNTFSGLPAAAETIYGGGFEWRPTERTLMRAVGEHRFFGSGWQATFSHRMPWLAWDVRATRDLSTFPQALLTLNSAGNVASLLDAILTTRYPDPVERARVVQDLIRRQGLPTSIGGPLTIYTQDPFIATGRSMTVGFLGINNTLSFSAAFQRVEGVFPQAVVVSATGVGNSEQLATALTYGRRLSPFTAFGMTASRTYIRGLGDAAVDETRQRAIRVVITRRLSARTEVLAGAGRQLTDAVTTADFTDNSAFIGFSKRF